MQKRQIILIHPPTVKPSEPPAGPARLAGALRDHGVDVEMIDANLAGLYYLLDRIVPPGDTWSRRALIHRDRHLQALRSPETYRQPDRYRRAVADIGRLLSWADSDNGILVELANYTDAHLSPVRSADLHQSAQTPERNPYHDYYQKQVLPRILPKKEAVVGLSINYLSQALNAFALIGLIKRTDPRRKIIIGGGLVTSWWGCSNTPAGFEELIDWVVTGPGEAALLQALEVKGDSKNRPPDYDDLVAEEYLSPGFVLPFSASSGCWWRKCRFCPEQSEKQPFRPLPMPLAADQLQRLVARTRPALIHLLDNAISPAMLKHLVSTPPGAPWYGFVRIGPPLEDPDFCRALAAAGCAMLKIGLESGNQQVLDALEKGVRLKTASQVLGNLHQAGIAAYVYLLFGTPTEDETAAMDTLAFTADHAQAIDFLNLAVFNLPLGSPEADSLFLNNFYPGDLALYQNFQHPRGWDRKAVRRFLEKRFKKHPAIQPIIRRDPPVFDSNHAAFFI